MQKVMLPIFLSWFRWFAETKLKCDVSNFNFPHVTSVKEDYFNKELSKYNLKFIRMLQ